MPINVQADPNRRALLIGGVAVVVIAGLFGFYKVALSGSSSTTKTPPRPVPVPTKQVTGHDSTSAPKSSAHVTSGITPAPLPGSVRDPFVALAPTSGTGSGTSVSSVPVASGGSTPSLPTGVNSSGTSLGTGSSTGGSGSSSTQTQNPPGGTTQSTPTTQPTSPTTTGSAQPVSILEVYTINGTPEAEVQVGTIIYPEVPVGGTFANGDKILALDPTTGCAQVLVGGKSTQICSAA